ncbi:hypothetical protein [Nissabacter sp. SGAir0207]|uniref:hypothetical protein n=1 Tax=Nissabacter sp. SGAir0207 TaxID=2126321 RepID=UPI0010F84821|nr:hypothetical protein [Nissabacter sp. SGAir0207]
MIQTQWLMPAGKERNGRKKEKRTRQRAKGAIKTWDNRPQFLWREISLFFIYPQPHVAVPLIINGIIESCSWHYFIDNIYKHVYCHHQGKINHWRPTGRGGLNKPGFLFRQVAVA